MSMTMPRLTLEFDLADRIRKAMRSSGVGVQELADELEVNRNTVGNWINGRIEPNRRTVMAIAAVTGAPFEWLEAGLNAKAAPSEDEAAAVRPEGLEPPTFCSVADSALGGMLWVALALRAVHA